MSGIGGHTGFREARYDRHKRACRLHHRGDIGRIGGHAGCIYEARHEGIGGYRGCIIGET